VYIPEADFMFNQFLVDGEEPLMFHTGPRRLFPIVSEAINQYGQSTNCAGSRSATWRPTSAAP
jgi:hypothetical protein